MRILALFPDLSYHHFCGYERRLKCSMLLPLPTLEIEVAGLCSHVSGQLGVGGQTRQEEP